MTKSFVEFNQSDQEAELELSAYALTPVEQKAVRAELDAFEKKAGDDLALVTLDYTFMDADSVRATIRGEYNAVMCAMRKLEGCGWTWNE
jgi:hypothetical protein